MTMDGSFHATDPATGTLLEPAFAISTAEDVAEACILAAAAFDSFRELDPETRARFLDAVADRIEALGEVLIERAVLESGLPKARLTGERDRTAGQLRLFARVLRDGYWAGLTLDTPSPARQPVPRPDLRQRKIALGPVAVFGASNFPLAFSVAGGDTTAAWAAGCPVVVKGHPAHPGTSALVGSAIREAVEACGLPEGVFSLLQGPANELGAALVADPRIKAVGFTGSHAGGLALVEIAHKRREPIPVYAEMSSVNPVILFPAALANRAEDLAKGFVGSLTLGSGQFCTNPGIVLAVEGSDLDTFVQAAGLAIGPIELDAMLTAGIHSNYDRGVAALADHPGVQTVARSAVSSGCNRPQAAILVTDAATFLADASLSHEVFGAAALIVRCRSLAEIATVLEGVEGQLTVTLQLDEADHRAAQALLPLLERKAGRVLANGWPTGVEVSYAMVHGGPYPATSDGRSTSVGAGAIERFLRPVCYQNLPQALLPAMLRDETELRLPRMLDGQPG